MLIKYPLLLPFLFYLSGLLAGEYFPPDYYSVCIFIISGVGFLVLSGTKIFLRKNRLKISSLLLSFILFLGGYLYLDFKHTSLPPNHISKLDIPYKTSLSGTLYKYPDQMNKYVRLYVEVEKILTETEEIPASGRAMLNLYDPAPLSPDKGDRVLLKDIRIHPPRNFKNPGRFDYQGYLRDKDIYLIGSINKKEQIEIIAKNPEDFLSAFLHQFKRERLDFMGKAVSEPEASVIKAMVIGERSTISKEINQLFNIAGITHILAVSGLNVSFIAALTFFVLNFTVSYLSYKYNPKAFREGRALKFVLALTLIPVIFYSLLVGEIISAIRATLMISVFFILKFIERDSSPYYSLSLSAFIILLIFPQALWAIDFQLSFSAVFSIILGNELFSTNHKEEDNPRLPKTAIIFDRLKIFLITTVSATAGTLPLILFYFFRLSPYSLLVNLLVVPLSALITPIGLAGAILSDSSEMLGIFLVRICGGFTSLIISIARFSASLPYNSIRIGAPAVTTLILYYLFLFSLSIIKKGKLAKVLTMSTGLLFCLAFAFPKSESEESNFLKITALDVGQGTSTFIQFPNRQNMLIDGGGLYGDFDIGEAVLGSFLLKQGINRIDHLVLTHPDQDHIKGLFFIAREITVYNYWNLYETADKRQTDLKSILEKQNTVIHPTPDNTQISIGKVEVAFIHPTKKFIKEMEINEKKIKENNFSGIVKITYDNFSFLLTGDMEKIGEKYLIENNLPLNSQIMTIPHHGSKGSSSEEFINKINPTIAIASVGFLNHFGHPREEVLERYRKLGITIYRTDLHGAIEVRSDGETFGIKTHENL